MTRTGNKMKYKAVIFDMDGVLIDSEYFYLERTYRELVKRYPWIRIEELYPIVGMSGKTERILMHELARRPLDDLQFDEELEEIYQSGHIADFTEVLYPEVKEILRWLKEQGLQIALASSSPVHCISQMLDQCDIRDYFESVISGESLVMSKPDPEIYQITMNRLGRKPEECLIVEDSTYGIEAGVAAGAAVAARKDERFCFDQSKAAYHIADLKGKKQVLL